jgi:spore coat polysaccharide biosynthesis protein SpsF (cytidylyltransferase family)
MSIVAVIAARMGSSRLPGKALRLLAGKPLLGHLLDRVMLARRLDGIVVATSTRPENDAIAAYCASRAVACFRGDEDDVLGRMLQALRAQAATVGVQVFGDGPLIDPAIIDQVVCVYQEADGAIDFVGNDLATTWPPGMEAEAFSVAALVDSDRRCSDAALRAHGTLFLRRNPALYRLRNVEAPPELRRPELELEVDTAEDLPVIEAALTHFAGRPRFGLADLIAFLDSRPEIAALNRHVPRRWKALRAPA